MKRLTLGKISVWDRWLPIAVYGCCLFLYSWKCEDPIIPLRLLGFSICVLGSAFFTFFTCLKARSSIELPPLPALILWGVGFLFGLLSLTGALEYAEGILSLLKYALFFAFLVLMVHQFTTRPHSVKYWVQPLLILTPLLSLLGILQYWMPSLVVYPGMPGAIGTMANPNLYASAQLLTIPLLLLGLPGASKWQKVGVGTGIGLAVIAVLHTESKSGVLALGILLLIFVPLLIRDHIQSKQTGIPFLLQPLSHGIGIGIGIILLTIAGFLYLPGKTATAKVNRIFPTQNRLHPKFNSIQERVFMYQKSVEMTLEHPIRGVGAGNWRIYAPSKGILGMNVSFGDRYFVRPHNDFLWKFSEWGLIGGMAYLGYFGFLLIWGLKARRRSKVPQQKFQVTVALMGILAYITIAFFNFPEERVTPALFLALFSAVIFSGDAALQKSKQGPRWILWLIVGLALTTGIFNGLRYVSGKELQKVKAEHIQSHWQSLIPMAREADAPWMRVDQYSGTPFLFYEGVALINTGQTDAALSAFQAAHEINPWHPHLLNNLATVYEMKGNHAQSIPLFEECHLLFPDFEEGTLNLTAAYFNAGRIQEADQTLKKVKRGTKNPKYPVFKDAIRKALRTKP